MTNDPVRQLDLHDRLARSKTGLNWVIQPWVLLCIAAACVAYVIVTLLLGVNPIIYPGPNDRLFNLRLHESLLLWTVLCSLAGWLAVAQKSPPPGNSRIWPIVLISALIGIYLMAYDTVNTFRSTNTSRLVSDWPFYAISAIVYLSEYFFLCGVLVLQGFFWRKYGSKNTCFECGYDMTGNISGRCPECGTQFVPHTTYSVYILSRTYPELLLFETAEKQQYAWKRAQKRVVKSSLSIMLLFYTILALYLLHLLSYPKANWFQSSIGERWRWVVIVLLCLGSLIFVWRIDKLYHRFLRQQLRENDIPVCLKCGANLREVPGGACPKCGSAVEGK